MSSPFAIVAGVGPGTGATVARKFGAAYPVALLARNPANYEDAVKDIKAAGGKAIGVSTDVTDAKSVKNAVAEAQKVFGDKCAAAVFNVGGKFVRKPFLELDQEEFESGWEGNGYVYSLRASQWLSSILTHASADVDLFFSPKPSFLCSSTR
ncbi:MAG: hypothetical protein L6R41_002752 [Letrouitia leprolyta]|nr:MAG: hypothetical protein L6R41_002752 [Letrouitia leprolyta]